MNKDIKNIGFITTKGILLYILPIPLLLPLLYFLFSVKVFKFSIMLVTIIILYYIAGINYRTQKGLFFYKKYGLLPKGFKDERKKAMFILGGVAFLPFFSSGLKNSSSIESAFILAIMSMLGFYFAYGIKSYKKDTHKSVANEKKQEDNLEKVISYVYIKGAKRDISHLSNIQQKVIKDACNNIDKIKEEADLFLNNDKELYDTIYDIYNLSSDNINLIVDSPDKIQKARKLLHVYLFRVFNIINNYRMLGVGMSEDDIREQLVKTLLDVKIFLKDKTKVLMKGEKDFLSTQLRVLQRQISERDTNE